MFLANIIGLILLSVFQFCSISHAMFGAESRNKEIMIGQITTEGQIYAYYALMNNKDKNRIHVTNRTNKPLILRSAVGGTIIIPKATESATLDETYASKLKSGQKVSFLIKSSKKENLIGYIDADILLRGGNFTIMRRPAQKDEF